MEVGTVQIMVKVLRILVCALIAVLLVSIYLMSGQKKVLLRAYENICMQAKKQNGFFDYERLEKYLCGNGATYHYGKWVNPVSYSGLCLVSALFLLVIGLSWGIVAGLFGAGVGFFLPGILLEYMNKKDNEKMLTELNLIYSALSIQIRAGVYVTDALAECYGSVSQIRLREALQNLSGDIVMKADLDSALECFQGQFNNRYIDSLCITILQATESGQAVELLGDIAEQIKDMELILQQKKKEKLNRSVTFYQLGIFALILVLVLYACVVHLFSAELFF